MIVIENTTLYKCEYCRKKYERKNSCEKHEKWCNKKPENKRACHGCDFLQPVEIKEPHDYGVHKFQAFKCTKLDIMVYPLSVERRGLNKIYETFDNQYPMPRKCVDFSENLPF